MNNLMRIYEDLYKKYGPQGWWPIDGKYHKNDYSFPKDQNQRFEIICGCILTQNTSWKQVEKALENLRNNKALQAKKIIDMDIEDLKELIRPAGYFNQKSERLRIVASWFIKKENQVPSREELLKIKGIGNETADSILLYAYNVAEFVIDAYTKRLMIRLGLVDEKISYLELKAMFEESIDKDHRVYQEFHALIVENEKQIKKDNPNKLKPRKD